MNKVVLRARCSGCGEVVWGWTGPAETHEGKCYANNTTEGEPAVITVENVAPEHAHNSDHCKEFGSASDCNQGQCRCRCHDQDRRCQICGGKAVIRSVSWFVKQTLYRCWKHRAECAPDVKFVYIEDPQFAIFGGHWGDHQIPKLPGVAAC